MTEIRVGELTFAFPEQYEATKYDDWSFYQKRFQSIQDGTKAVDIVCVAPSAAWLVEVKDYRKHVRTKPSEIAEEMAAKVRDTLSGLAAASANADSKDEKDIAKRALRRRHWRVALHLEQAEPTASALWPRVIDDAKLLQKLRSRLRAVDGGAVVVSLGAMSDGVPWTAA